MIRIDRAILLGGAPAPLRLWREDAPSWRKADIGREADIVCSSPHAGDDIWVAEQIARNIEDCGATAFLDRRDIVAGDNFKRRLREEIAKCDELLALFTPWSRRRAWVRHEIGMADILKKRIVCVFYKVTVADFHSDEDGLGPLDGLNTIEINGLETYFRALRRRAG